MSRMEDTIIAKLQDALSPLECRIENESARHAGHAGAASGGHFRLHIVAEVFAGKNRIQRHRMVYDALADLMDAGIHALAISASTPEEAPAKHPQASRHNTDL